MLFLATTERTTELRKMLNGFSIRFFEIFKINYLLSRTRIVTIIIVLTAG